MAATACSLDNVSITFCGIHFRETRDAGTITRIYYSKLNLFLVGNIHEYCGRACNHCCNLENIADVLNERALNLYATKGEDILFRMQFIFKQHENRLRYGNKHQIYKLRVNSSIFIYIAGTLFYIGGMAVRYIISP